MNGTWISVRSYLQGVVMQCTCVPQECVGLLVNKLEVVQCIFAGGTHSLILSVHVIWSHGGDSIIIKND